MKSNLRTRAVHGVLWSFLERIGQQGIQFVISVVLARLLLPEQFGLIAMLSVFIEVSRAFMDSGLSAALVQRKDASQLDNCSMFYFNVLVGIACAGLLSLVAPWVAAFYDEPVLTALLRALSLTLVINSLAGVQTALLNKQINFRTLLKVGMTATALSGFIGVGMALLGFGVWSLVAQYLASSVFRTAFLWLNNTWRPQLVFSGAALRRMLGFGAPLLASGLLNRVFANVYLVVIGKLFSAAHLGLYATAFKIQHLFVVNVAAVVTRVTFPVFAEIQDDPPRLKRCVREAASMLAFVHFPLMIGLALTARPLVYLLLTEKWEGSIRWLQLLAVAGLLYPLHSLHLNLLKAKGHSALFFRLEVIKRVLIVIMIAITYRWGVSGMIYGQIAMSGVCYLVNSFYTPRLISYGLSEQLRDLTPYAGIAVLMGVVLYGLPRFLPPMGYAPVLLVQIVSGTTVYLSLSLLFGLPAAVQVSQAIRDRFGTRALSMARS
jgi:O-antigen/teichoic acid export membrane protein